MRGGGTGFKSQQAVTHSTQAFREKAGRGLPLTPCRPGLPPVPDHPLQKGAAGYHHCPGRQLAPIYSLYAAQPPSFYPQRRHLSPHTLNLRVPQQHPLGLEGVQIPVYLHAQALNRRAFRTIKHAGVDGCGIGQPAHQTTQGLYFGHQLALTRPTHRRVTGHQTNAFRVRGDQTHPGAQPGCRPGCLDPSMPTAHHNNVIGPHPHQLPALHFSRGPAVEIPTKTPNP